MALTFTRDLDPLTSSGLELDDPSRDLRGRDVVDRNGSTVGTVAEMLIDPGLRVARMLVLETGGGLLGMGKKQYLVPLEAVNADGSQVRMQWTKEEITNEPEYHLADGEEEELQYVQVYAAYGIRPYWEVEAESPSTTTRRAENQLDRSSAPAMELRLELHQRVRHQDRSGLAQRFGRHGGASRHADGRHASRDGGAHVPGRVADAPAVRRRLMQGASGCQQQIRSGLGMLDGRAVHDGRGRVPAPAPSTTSRPAPCVTTWRSPTATAFSSSQRSSSRAPGSACGSWLSDS